ncbi:DUF3055 domain-containing protein [Salipaludibacillus agaradhaerens]|uniref:DUF3055 domain-containing protein n=1 Tax=Salipaludibacillus agaradhaerens TaxID=76935 RepID=A0A9Q4FY14_SALAG|nr:DUF3055 domain-containing protein [Salipaludibacillus agaradhaerens]UJW58917.1 DUF3055 domain-containing protein [Bacillus sp. A116_S68]MCR6095253.1 DUF3055 domain-containing protein [Salipaludibacillus agaradhaerens]MCR6107842.1 DUF3055 domain-containing protein [Salipaludibacillus agaradhaerens]MCR6115189.1 DUF3055 domain-containing protein [Salipaludibacillus agaradhaerens]MCR6119871.1 DUF3055 domain-containing protein [Salipaludibacillus agaradhaerens]
MTERFFLYDDSEETKTRFVSFMGENQRFDLAIITTTRYYGKKLVLNMLSSRYAIIGTDDLEEDNYLETVFELNSEDGQELREFLYEII